MSKLRIDVNAIQQLHRRLSPQRMEDLGRAAAKIAASQAGYEVLAPKLREMAPMQKPGQEYVLNQFLPPPYNDPKRTRKYPGMAPGDLRRSIKLYRVKKGADFGTVEYHIGIGVGKKGQFVPGWYGHMVNAGHKWSNGFLPAKMFRKFGPIFASGKGVVAAKRSNNRAAARRSRNFAATLFMQRIEAMMRSRAVAHGMDRAKKFVRRAL